MSRATSSAREAGVLIVGAGPTGLTLANALAAWDIPFTIVDRKGGPSRDSKALALNLASQHVLETLGMTGALGLSNGRLHRVTVHWKDLRLTTVDLRRLNFDHREMIVQPQADTENELLDALRRRGREVKWNTRVVDIGEYDQHVDALIELADGSRSVQTFAYAVGCEGKGSLVANRIGTQYSGTDYPAHFVLGDFSMRWNESRHEGHYHVDDEGFFIVLPVGESHWRVVVKHDGPVPDDRPVNVRDITDYVEKRLGKGIFTGAPVWLSRADFYMRVADRLRSKRLFIAGDAAHLFSPIGGTGMNTGMQDALNLAWKLALCQRGVAGDDLLDSYETERLEIIRATAAATDRSTRLIARLDNDPVAIAPLLPKMSNRKMLRTMLPLLHSGLGVACPQAFPGASDDTVPGSRRAGQLCLGLRAFKGLAGSETGAVPKLLVLARPRTDADEGGLVRLVAGMRDYADFVETVVLREESAALRFGDIGPGGLLLVCPDATIAYSGAVSHSQRLLQTLVARFANCGHPSMEAIADAA